MKSVTRDIQEDSALSPGEEKLQQLEQGVSFETLQGLSRAAHYYTRTGIRPKTGEMTYQEQQIHELDIKLEYQNAAYISKKETPMQTISQPLPMTIKPTLEQFLTVGERKGARLIQRGKQDERGRRADIYRLEDGSTVTVEYIKAGKRRFEKATLRRIQA